MRFGVCKRELWHEIRYAWEFLRLNLKTDPKTALREEMYVFWKPYNCFGAKCWHVSIWGGDMVVSVTIVYRTSWFMVCNFHPIFNPVVEISKPLPTIPLTWRTRKHHTKIHHTYLQYRDHHYFCGKIIIGPWRIHPGKLAWNLKITCLKREIIFQTCIFGFHVSFQGCNMNTSSPKKPSNQPHLWIEDDRPSGFGHRSQFKFTRGGKVGISLEPKWATKKNLLLSMKYWLVYRDPCLGLLKSPYNWVV